MSKKSAQATAQLVKLFVNAGQATAGPPIGPALGSKGVKAIDFCKQFNEQSQKIYATGVQLRVQITVRPDRTFSIDIRAPSTSYLLKKAAGIEKGSGQTGHEVVGTVSLKHIYEIAKIKKTDPVMEPLELRSICRLIIGSCKSVGLSVVH